MPLTQWYKGCHFWPPGPRGPLPNLNSLRQGERKGSPLQLAASALLGRPARLRGVALEGIGYISCHLLAFSLSLACPLVSKCICPFLNMGVLLASTGVVDRVVSAPTQPPSSRPLLVRLYLEIGPLKRSSRLNGVRGQGQGGMGPRTGRRPQWRPNLPPLRSWNCERGASVV